MCLGNIRFSSIDFVTLEVAFSGEGRTTKSEWRINWDRATINAPIPTNETKIGS